MSRSDYYQDLEKQRKAFVESRRRYERPVVAPTRQDVSNVVTEQSPAPVAFTQQPMMGAVAMFRASMVSLQGPLKPRQKVARYLRRNSLSFAASILVLFGVGLGVFGYFSNQRIEEQAKVFVEKAEDSGEVAVDPSTGQLIERSSSNRASSTGECTPSTNPRVPARVVIESIGVDACMTTVSINSKGNVGSPANIHNASWYYGSQSPIEAFGTSLVVGHAGTPKYEGVFAKLHQVNPGSEIVVTMGDGVKKTYTVTGLEDVRSDSVDMATLLGSEGNDDDVLRIITCVGDYNPRTVSYDHRLVVTAISQTPTAP